MVFLSFIFIFCVGCSEEKPEDIFLGGTSGKTDESIIDSSEGSGDSSELDDSSQEEDDSSSNEEPPQEDKDYWTGYY